MIKNPNLRFEIASVRWNKLGRQFYKSFADLPRVGILIERILKCYPENKVKRRTVAWCGELNNGETAVLGDTLNDL